MSLFYHTVVDKDTVLLLSQHIFSRKTFVSHGMNIRECKDADLMLLAYPADF